MSGIFIADLERWGSSPVHTITQQPSARSFVESGLTNFLDDIALTEVKPARQTKAKRAAPLFWKEHKKNLLVGGGILGGWMLFACIVFSLRSNDGTLVVKVNEPDAEVQILNEEGKVEITRKGDTGPITIPVVPGKHQLRVQKDGFELFT